MKKLRVGVIGLGIGGAHVRDFTACPNAEVVAVADMDAERLEARADELGVAGRYTDAEEMLKKESLDIVSVATPNISHKDLAIAGLQAGCHVVCEKPMAMNAAEAREMMSAAKEAGRRLMINFSFRFSPASWALKREIDSGTLGDVYFARTVWLRRRGFPGFGGWFGQKALSGGGPLIDLGVHRLDLALWFMGYPKPEWVIGRTYNHIAAPIGKKEGALFDVEDFAAAFIKFENGSSLELEASWAANIRENELIETRLLGTKAGLLHRNVHEVYDFQAEIFTDRDGQQWDMTPHAPIKNAPTAMRHFVDCITENRPHTATGEEGLMVMELLDAIYRSAENGEPVKIADEA